jgi:rod shape-determining protein MreD
MIKFEKISLIGTIIKYFPILLLLASVLNEFDFNYMGFKYFSFNFPFILIFYWSLKKSGSLGYGLIFIAGLFNDVVVGLPMGVSSLTYLLICGFAAYLRNITLRPNLIKDWFFFLFTIALLNSLNYILLTLFFSFKISYEESLFNLFFTFVFYIIFAYIFDIYQKIIMGKLND